MKSLHPEALELQEGKTRLEEIYQQAATLETKSSVKRPSLPMQEIKNELDFANMDTEPTRAIHAADYPLPTSPAMDSLTTLLKEHVEELKTQVTDSETLRKRMFGEVEALQQERRVKDAHFQKTIASITDIADVELPPGL